MSALHAGLLKHRVIIERQVTTVDAFGGQQTNWQLHRVIWAHLSPLSNMVDAKTDSLIARSRYDVSFRTDNSITVNMRMIVNGIAHVVDTVALHKQEGFMQCRISGEYL